MKIKTRRYYIYYLATIIGFVIAILPLSVGLFLANLAGRIAFAIVGKERRRTLENLKSSFPEKTDAEIRQIAIEVFSNLCKNAVELLNIYKLNKKNLTVWIKAEGIEKVREAFSKGKGVVMLASHFGNWELMAIYFSLIGFPTSIIAKRIYFDRYENFIRNLRTSKGLDLIYRDESPKKMLRALKQNRALGILADQDVDSVDGVFVDFFGRSCYTPKAPVLFALASGAPILPGFIVREGNRHRFIIGDAIELEEKATKEETVRYNTQKWSRVLESYVRKYPAHWVWMHRRWKTRPEDKK